MSKHEGGGNYESKGDMYEDLASMPNKELKRHGLDRNDPNIEAARAEKARKEALPKLKNLPFRGRGYEKNESTRVFISKADLGVWTKLFNDIKDEEESIAYNHPPYDADRDKKNKEQFASLYELQNEIMRKSLEYEMESKEQK